ncbi:hypothetical protein CDLVIII_1632 [Clostridium sp. DL-VIII]|uniref:O-antigen polymerase n=1 Tax=Clostridium sp. DL-VIII TaxID=641107 RepID=UPI00023AFC86|nr:O-antigen polymerase [Clostridium sp. DL-VIII]EHI98323.1 hypothetical protein CDLVIII_1632 [Clostridium sp. DL-VIII]
MRPAVIVCCIIFLLIAVIAAKWEKKICNPITILLTLWSIIMFLSMLQLYTLYPAKDRTYYLIIGGLVSFIIGYVFISICIFGKTRRISLNGGGINPYDGVKNHLNYKLTYIFALICIIYLLVNFGSYGIELIKSGFSLGVVQDYLYNTDNGGNSGIFNAIGFLITNPMYIAINATTAVDFWMGKRDKKLLVCCLLILLLRIVSTGGRQSAIQFAIFMIVAYTFSLKSKKEIRDRQTQKEERKKKKIFLIVGVLVVISLIIMTMSRTKSAWKTIYLDFAMQPYMFEYWSEKVSSTGQYGYGFASWIGFSYPCFYVVKNLLPVLSVPDFFAQIYDLTLSVMNEWNAIGDILRANAYVSVFWYLFYDAREVGIVIGMFLLGFFANLSYVKTKRLPSERNICLYSLMVVLLFYTFGDLEIAKPNFALAIIYIRFVLYSQKTLINIHTGGRRY